MQNLPIRQGWVRGERLDDGEGYELEVVFLLAGVESPRSVELLLRLMLTLWLRRVQVEDPAMKESPRTAERPRFEAEEQATLEFARQTDAADSERNELFLWYPPQSSSPIHLSGLLSWQPFASLCSLPCRSWASPGSCGVFVIVRRVRVLWSSWLNRLRAHSNRYRPGAI